MRLFSSVVAAIVLGCSSLLPPVSQGVSNECLSYDDSFVTWSAVGIASGSLAGAAGASGILSATLADLPGADAALAASSAVLGALAAVAGWASGHYAGRYAEHCQPSSDSQPTPERQPGRAP